MRTEGISIKIAKYTAEEFFYNAMCNAIGTGYMQGYGLKIDYDSESYKQSKEKLKKDNNNVCFEDVLMQILRDGGELTLVDTENEGEYTRSININDVHERVEKMPIDYLFQMIEENDDATTADVLLQTVFYEDVIFG